MKQLITTVLILVVGFGALTIMSGFSDFQPKKPWVVPEVAKGKKNPVPAGAQVLATGKALWSTHCKSCHGTKGLGDGPKAAQLKTEPGDFSKDLTNQTDGALFFKTSDGRDDMPSFKKKIADEDDRWALVHFMRSLQK